MDGRVVRAGGGAFEEVPFLIGVDPFGGFGRSAWVGGGAGRGNRRSFDCVRRGRRTSLRVTILEGVGGAGWREFGDGGDEAVGFVENEVFDEVGLG